MTWLPLTLILGQTGGGSSAASWVGMVPFVLVFAVMYFLLIRPANKQRKDHQDLLNTLKKDDEVVTSGGVYGRIMSIDEQVAVLEISDKVRVKILKDRIAGRWSPSAAAGK